MKVCKVSMGKIITEGGARCVNTYPSDYDAEIMEIISYEQKDLPNGTHVSFCIALVPDDFTFTADMVEMTEADAEMCIDDCSADIVGALEGDEKTAAMNKFKTSRKQKLTDGLAFAQTCEEKKDSYAISRGKK